MRVRQRHTVLPRVCCNAHDSHPRPPSAVEVLLRDAPVDGVGPETKQVASQALIDDRDGVSIDVVGRHEGPALTASSRSRRTKRVRVRFATLAHAKSNTKTTVPMSMRKVGPSIGGFVSALRKRSRRARVLDAITAVGAVLTPGAHVC